MVVFLGSCLLNMVVFRVGVAAAKFARLFVDMALQIVCRFAGMVCYCLAYVLESQYIPETSKVHLKEMKEEFEGIHMITENERAAEQFLKMKQEFEGIQGVLKKSTVIPKKSAQKAEWSQDGAKALELA